MRRALRVFLAVAVLCGLSGAQAAPPLLPVFSEQAAGSRIIGWTPWTLSGKAAPADFRLVELDGQVVLRAEAVDAASALIHAGRVDPAATPWLNWRWRADRLPEGGRFGTHDGDDYALRVYVLFDYDISRLGLATRLKMRLARALYGSQLPAAVLCYVWDTRAVPGSRVWSAYTDRVRMIAVDGAGSAPGRWRAVSRNVADDFREAFGEDAPAITGVVVASDTDNTHGNALGYFGDLSFDTKPLP